MKLKFCKDCMWSNFYEGGSFSPCCQNKEAIMKDISLVTGESSKVYFYCKTMREAICGKKAKFFKPKKKCK